MIRDHVTGETPPPRLGVRMRRALILPAFLALLWLWNASLADAQPAYARTPQANLTQKTTFGGILRIPGDFSTIQNAVDAAKSGDLVLIAPGVYHEAVRVKTADLTIRGEDRNSTILDGEQKLTNGFTVQANGVVIENLTAHHYVGNGFFWTGVTGYRGSYLTAYDNGDYGIYAFNAVQGQFDHSYASGSPDSGFYIGQCHPCDALITDVNSENNALGYSGTNAGGNLVIQNSTWRNNGAGIVPNTLDSEKRPPEWGTTVVNNLVEDNGNVEAPSFPLERPFFGVGIGVPGGDLNYIARNTVRNNSDYGILVSGIIDDNFWLASGNVVEGNKVSGSGVADIALASPSGANNCFQDNQAATTLPPFLEVSHACGTPLPLNGGGDFSITMRLFARFMFASGPSYHSTDYRKVPAPPAQPNIPDVNAARGPIFSVPFALSTDSAAPSSGVGKGGPAMFQPLGFTTYTVLQLLLALYGNLLIFALYAAWLAIAFWELSQRKDISSGLRLGWGAAVLAVPILGPLAYYVTGSKLTRGFRLALLLGAPLLCLVITAVLMIVAQSTL
jgi:hypothetical protein